MSDEPNWRPMTEAPRDGRTIIAKRHPPRGNIGKNRKYNIIKIGWYRGRWISRTVLGASHTDENFVGWLPESEAGHLVYKFK